MTNKHSVLFWPKIPNFLNSHAEQDLSKKSGTRVNRSTEIAKLTLPLNPMQIRPAFSTEAEAISALAIRSKAHWGYPEEQMAVFRQELILSEDQVTSKQTHVLEADGEIAGYYTLLPHNEKMLELEHLFVEPTRLHQGYGSQLFKHACKIAQKANFRVLVIQSDPNASGFYRALGAQLTQEIPSSIPGRFIPHFEFDLEKQTNVKSGQSSIRTHFEIPT